MQAVILSTPRITTRIGRAPATKAKRRPLGSSPSPRERGNRDKLIIATKVGFDRHGEGAGLKKAQIEYWIDESLRKLGTDYVDLYYAHTDDVGTPLEETMAAFDSLVRNGKGARSAAAITTPGDLWKPTRWRRGNAM
ncbi:MAG: aldo/keto reductase [Clostridia bacterium]